MRSTFVTVSVLALLITGTSSSTAQPKGERTTIKGEVVDLWCYLEGGDRAAPLRPLGPFQSAFQSLRPARAAVIPSTAAREAVTIWIRT